MNGWRFGIEDSFDMAALKVLSHFDAVSGTSRTSEIYFVVADSCERASGMILTLYVMADFLL